MTKTKQAWYINCNGWDYIREKVELTGRCKKTTGGPDDEEPRHRVEIQKYWFGYKCGTKWILKKYIKIYDVVTDEIYECDCFKETQDGTG